MSNDGLHTPQACENFHIDLPPVLAARKYDINFLAVPSQILLSGRSNDIGILIGLLFQEGFTVSNGGNPVWGIDDISIDQVDFTIRLYQFQNNQNEEINPWDLMILANNLASNNGPLFAVAEVNEMIHALPHTVGGGVHGGPTGRPRDPKRDHNGPDESYFREQWAFQEESGINLFNGDQYIHPSPRGEGVRVAIFDSSPLSTGPYPDLARTDNIPFNLYVHALLDDTAGTGTLLPDDFKEHGYFVASLVQAVAPRSCLDLVQVLDDHVNGTIGFLIKAIENYLAAFAAAYDSPPNDRLIMNLSLTLKFNTMHMLVDHAPGVSMVGKVTLAYQGLRALRTCLSALSGGLPEIKKLLDSSPDLADIPRFAFPLHFASLDTRHSKIRFLVVAAAGNEGTQDNLAPMPDMPASFHSVLGVAASGKNKKLALFGNDHKVWAPGGDYGVGMRRIFLTPPEEALSPDPASTPPLSEWVAATMPDPGRPPWIEDLGLLCEDKPNECPNAVIGRATTETDHRTGKRYRYLLWWGSSFASPQASGLAALVWSKRPALGPQEVRKAIKDNLTNNIINVQNTLRNI